MDATTFPDGSEQKLGPTSLRSRDRFVLAMGVGALHALLGFALVSGLGVSVVQEVSDNLKAFDVLPVVPEPPELPVEPPKQSLQERSTQSEGAASPANLRQLPTPVPVPVPVG